MRRSTKTSVRTALVVAALQIESGHSGGRPLNKQIEEQTDTLSFLFWQLGVAQ